MPASPEESFADFIKTAAPELMKAPGPITPEATIPFTAPFGEGTTPQVDFELSSTSLFLAELDTGPALLRRAQLAGLLPRILRKYLLHKDYKAIEREALHWRRAKLGLRQAPTSKALNRGGIDVINPPSNPSSLLLLHGIFSHAAESFRDLANSDFYQKLTNLYGDRIYAFNHLSASQSIEASARQLLKSLPSIPTTYDVIAHSRGGLVLRAIVERGQSIAPDLHERFRLGRAILACVPNQGTNLMTDDGLETLHRILSGLTPGLTFTNFLHLLRFVRDDLPGLTDMLPTSAFINAFPSTSAGLLQKYAALAVDFELYPVDNGLDEIIGPRNDLAVPTPACTKVGPELAQIARNFTVSSDPPSYPSEHEDYPYTWHTTVFTRARARDFIIQHLSNSN